MKNASKFNLRLSVISIGVIGLFSISSAMADDEELKALTQPKSSVQVEMIGVDQNSAKFGEYNGLYGHPSGAYPNGGLNIRGGSAYTGNEQGNTNRWSVTGENLGLTSRSANASVADQGSWNFGVNFDQLQHNISNSYQTPYQGTNGGSLFTLPINLKGSTQINTTTSDALRSDLNTMGISSTRYNTTVNGQTIVDKNLNFTFEYNNLTQTGAKLQSFVGAQNYGGSNNAGNKEMSSVLPMPTNYKTDTLNLGVNWKNENAFLNASFFGSYFTNNNNSVQWEVMNGTTTSTGTNYNPIQTTSLAPSNAFNQLNLAGGYDFTKKTKLTSNLSIGQNIQNQGFGGTYDAGMIKTGTTVPSSMNGLVNTTHADIKVTDQSAKDLTLTAGAKFDQRDNLTQSNMYQTYNLTSGVGVTPNTPLSIKQTQLLLGGDYKITRDQKVSLTASNNAVQRWCNQYGTTAPNVSVTQPYNSLFYNSTNCSSATSSNENKLDGLYKIKASEDVNLKLGAGYANRKTQWDQTAFIAMPKLGYDNSANYLGYMPFFEASRKQAYAKAGVDWQATENLNFTLGGKYTGDTYPDSYLGVQNGYSWSLNFDSTYAYDANGSASLYATQQNMQRNYVQGTSPTISPTQPSVTVASPSATFTNNLATNATTLGLGVKHGGLMGGKLSLSADATYSMANSIYNTGGVLCSPPSSANSTICGSLPGITNNLAIIKLGSVYQLDKNSKVGLMYWYQHLYSNDWYYNTQGYGTTNAAGITPTNQTSPSYSVNVIMANYTYTFD